MSFVLQSGKSTYFCYSQASQHVFGFFSQASQLVFLCLFFSQAGQLVFLHFREAHQFADDLDITNSTYYKRAMYSTDFMFTTGKAVTCPL